ncbi:phosphotriesterase family protein [Timonella sp. A28]|uniref:phosphotriesterase family protein n=1 Tax=Timonella sp. A28 TaxID=3442640 RepID=UPI003EB92119
MTTNEPTLITVLGEVPQSQMGLTLPHEHLFNDLSSVVDEPSYEFSKMLVGADVDPSLMWALRQDPYCCADNIAPKPVDNVVTEVQAFANIGGRTIVDATGTAAIGRAPEKLVAVAKATGLNVVMSTGPYLEKFEGKRITARTIDEQASEMVAELQTGVAGTGIRAGMIGEIGVSPFFTEAERGALRAAAIAATECPNIALNIHMPGWQRRGDEVLDLVLNEVGVAPHKVSLAHSDPSGKDTEYQHRLLDRGVWLEFDMIGLDITFPKEGVSPTPDDTATAISGLIEAGYDKQIVMSHDLFLKQMWTQNGGNGFAYVPNVFLELLKSKGVSQEICTRLVTENPQRLLTR